MPGNRYAAALDPQMAGPPPGADQQMPPQAQPQGAQQAGPQEAAPDPALVEAFQILSGHQGPIAELLKDPEKLPHIRVAFEAVKQDPGAQQALAKQGIGPQQLQQFEQMLVQAEKGTGGGQPAAPPHWLAR